MRRLLYPLFGVLVLGGYTGALLSGWDPFTTNSERRNLPAEARAAPGGYRHFPTFWGIGYLGGK